MVTLQNSLYTANLIEEGLGSINWFIESDLDAFQFVGSLVCSRRFFTRVLPFSVSIPPHLTFRRVKIYRISKVDFILESTNQF